MGEFLRLVKKENVAIDKVKVTPAQTGELLNYLKKGTVSGKLAKLIFQEMFKTGREAEEIIETGGLKQITDETSLEKVVGEVLKENPQGVNDFKAGKEKALGYLVGQIMKKTKGKANPQLVNRFLREKISNLPQ
jgi:aspartyl-tRNA(Asn)/glutamyl-tRNA(Gln) amidotransferase subunit B